MSYLSKKSNTFKGDIVKKLKPLGGVMSVKTNKTHGYFNHISVSLDLISDYNLTGDQAILLHKIYMLSQQEPCFASNKFLGQGWGKSANAISKLIARLSEKELVAVEIEYEENSKQVKKRIIHINMGCEDDTLSSDKQGVMPDCHGGSCQVGEDNILDKNIITNKEKDIYININTQKESEINIPFDQVWDAYDRKEGRYMAETRWLKLSDKERSLVAECIPKYVADNPNKKYRKHFATFLNQKTWKDYESSNKAIEQRDKTISILLDKLQSGEFNRRDCGEYIRQEGHSIDDELYIKHKLIELGCFKEDA